MSRSAMHWGLLVLCAFCTLKVTSEEMSPLYLDEIRSLSELPMNKLIQIRSFLASENDIADEDGDTGVSSRRLSLTMPMALPMSAASSTRNGRKKSTRRYDHYEEKDKDTKVSKIFQLAITALSFLAFGGYLITLIIMAIRRNNPPNDGNVIVLSNLQNLQNRPKRNILIFDPMENDFETERLYQGMIMLSRGYALYK